MADTLKSRVWQWLPLALVFLLLLASLVLLNFLTLTPKNLEHYGDWYLYFSVVLLVLLSVTTVANMVRMFNEWRTKQAGSRFTLRLMQGFLVLTLLPVLFVSLFAIQLIGPRIDRWFEASIGSALRDSLELSQLALESSSRQYLATIVSVQLHQA